MKIAWRAVLVAALLCACKRDPEQKAIRAAADALGGKSRIQAVRTLTIEGEGENPNLGQNVTPEAPLTVWKVTGFKQTIDPEKRRMRIEQVRTAQFPFALATVVSQNMAIDGDVAWNVNENGKAVRLTSQAARDRRLELLRHPITILRAAFDPGSKSSNYRESGNLRMVDITASNGDMVSLSLNAATWLPASVRSTSDQPNLGDVAVETFFGDYEDVNGLKLPRRLTTQIDRWVQSDIRVSKNTVNGEAGEPGRTGGHERGTARASEPSDRGHRRACRTGNLVAGRVGKSPQRGL